MFSRLDLPPGRYQLRIAARIPILDRTGSVYEVIDVPDLRREPLALSGVVLSSVPREPDFSSEYDDPEDFKKAFEVQPPVVESPEHTAQERRNQGGTDGASPNVARGVAWSSS